MKKILSILVIFAVFISGCTQSETHATQNKVDECFLDHAEDPYEEKLEHCQEEVCGQDIHCFEEVEEMSETYK